MKKFLPFILAAAMGLTQANVSIARNPKKTITQETAQKNGLQNLTDSLYNFGKIEVGKPVSAVFKFINTNNKPVVVSNVSTSCGCTTPEWSNAPVMQGRATEIKVGFKASSVGSFYKTITIYYGNNEQKNIYIKGEVIQQK